MLDWLTDRRNRKELPEYSALRSTTARGLPPDLKEAEDSQSSSLKSDDLIAIWAIFKAAQLARGKLYFTYALEAARAGQIEIARDVALETVGHVDLEDPRPHLLLGQLAVKLRDRELLREAKQFLRFLKLGRWEQKLDQVVPIRIARFRRSRAERH
jgi:hypothetical protein